MDIKLLADLPELRASIDKLTAAIDAHATVITANTEAITKSQEASLTPAPRRTRATKKEEPVEPTPPQEESQNLPPIYPGESEEKPKELPVTVEVPVVAETPVAAPVASDVSPVVAEVEPVKLTIVDVRRRANEIYTAGDEKMRRNLYALNQRYGIQTLGNLPESRYQDYMDDLDVAYIKDLSASHDPHEPKFPF